MWKYSICHKIVTCRKLAPSCRIWRDYVNHTVEPLGVTWSHLAPRGVTLSHFEPLGAKWRFYDKWRISTVNQFKKRKREKKRKNFSFSKPNIVLYLTIDITFNILKRMFFFIGSKKPDHCYL